MNHPAIEQATSHHSTTATEQPPIRVLVIDDSALYRKIVSTALKNIPNVELVGTAPNGKIGLQKIESLQPDFITLDLEMPDMNGIDVLCQLKKQSSNKKQHVLMVSAFTSEGAAATLEALENGAFDFVVKPSGKSLAENAQQLCDNLAQKIKTLQAKLAVRATQQNRFQEKLPTSQRPTAITPPNKKPVSYYDVITIGISTGGPNALQKLIPALPKSLPIPVLIVQHMPPIFTKSLADSLNRKSELTVSEAIDEQPVRPGEVLIAPGGKQMKVVRHANQAVIQITNDPPENSCQPSADYLFRSAVETYGGHVLGVIMTGMGHDGTKGCRQIRQAGGRILAQNEESCVVYGMPRHPVEEGIAGAPIPLTLIANQIKLLSNRRN